MNAKKRQNPWLTACFICVYGILLIVPVFSQENTGISWSLALFKKTAGGDESVSYIKPVRLADGDMIRFFITTEYPCYCYAFDESPDGSLSVLFHGRVLPGIELSLPEKSPWYVIEPPEGNERIYLVISRVPQKKIDSLITGQPLDARAVLDTVLEMKQSLSTIAEAPEKPVAIGGTARGIVSGGSQLVSRYEGQNLYVKTITIKH